MSPITNPFFRGISPGKPIMPGVLILEAMAQTGVLLAYLSNEEEFRGKASLFCWYGWGAIRQPVVPGDQLHFELQNRETESQALEA